MSAHLQFGPEWMRKPAKAGAGNGSSAGDATGAQQNGAQSSQATPAPPTASATAGSSGAPRPDSRRKASGGMGLSLGTNVGQAGASQGMPTPTTPSAHAVVSPGAFSFAAAAGGATGQQVTGTSRDRASSSTAGVASASGNENDPMRYSKRLLSLYSTEGQKGGTDNASLASPVQAAQHAPPAGPASAITPTRKKAGGLFDRDGRRNHGTPGEVASPVGLGGEPRGLNARAGTGIGRGTGSSSHDDKYTQQRPGLFQRGSANSVSLPLTNLSPTSLQHYRERERHGAGIQGGVLSSVAPGARKSKEGVSAPEGELSSSSRDPDATSSVDRPFYRATNEAFASVGRSRQTSYRSNTALPQTGVAPTPTLAEQPSSLATTEDEPPAAPLTMEEWVRLRKERFANDGPLGPPADHSGGFTRFYALDRKRQRPPRRSNTQSTLQRQQKQHEQQMRDAEPSASNNGQLPQESLTASNDMDLPQDAYTLVEALNLDEDDEQVPGLAASPEAAFAETQQEQAWSAEEAEWQYKDPSGQVQGPFKATVMQEWYAAKYFTDDLLVRPVEIDAFKPLGVVLSEIGNTDVPFLLPPSQYRINALPPKQSTVNHLLSGSRQQSTDGGDFARGPSEWNAGHLLPQHSNNVGFGNQTLHQSPYLPQVFGGVDTASPFGTPSAAFAELGDMSGNRQRQQEDYLAIIRQRELAEYRAMQEMQRHGEFPESTMYGQGLSRQDSAPALRSWNASQGGFAQANNWASPDVGALPQTFTQQMPEQRFQDHRQRLQFGSEQADFQSTPASHVEQPSQWNVQHEPASQQIHAPSQSNDPAPRDTSESAAMLPASSSNASAVVNETAVDEQVAIEEEKRAEEDANTGAPVEVDEDSPERLWPQSPKAVEFASESPIPGEDSTSLEEFTTKSKRNRRDKKRRDEQEADFAPAQTKSTASRTPANVNVVSEEQFRRSQASRSRNAGQAGSVMPLMSDTPTSAKTAPWASSTAASDTSNAGLSLREIQEAEERRAGALKASLAGRKQRVPSASDVNLPTSMSWGLASVPSNVSAVSSNTTNTAESGQAGGLVWNAGSRDAPKRTLTEIQEEERKRALKAQQAASAASPARGAAGKAYADSAVRTQAAAPAAAGWSVVGAGGKPSTPAASSASPAPTTRPGAATATRAPSSTGVAGSALAGWSTAGATGKGGNTAQASTAASARPMAPASTSVTRRTDAAASSDPTPSSGFVQYCKEQLKGIRSVSLDNFIEMLMQFPLDADNDTIDIIAEMVYANSSTLDGRRFAHDFVAKRKLDAAGRTGTNGRSGRNQGIANGALSGLTSTASSTASATNARASIAATPQPRSASEVLRSDAKAGSDSFGGFKVVKGKGTKKRA